MSEQLKQDAEKKLEIARLETETGVDSYILPDELNRGTSSIYIWMTQQVRNLLLLNL